MPEQQGLFHAQKIENKGEPSGVPFILKKNGNLVCDLCRGNFTCLSIINFKNVGWLQGSKFQFIFENEQINNYKLELCYDCNARIFSNSKILINFSQRLFDCLRR